MNKDIKIKEKCIIYLYLLTSNTLKGMNISMRSYGLFSVWFFSMILFFKSSMPCALFNSITSRGDVLLGHVL